MFEVECPSCKAGYQVDERRVPPTGLKMRCPKCGHSFQVEAGAAPKQPVLGAVLGLGNRGGGLKQTMLGVAAPAPEAERAPPPVPPRPGGLKQTMLGVAPAAAPKPAPPSDLELQTIDDEPELDLDADEAELPLRSSAGSDLLDAAGLPPLPGASGPKKGAEIELPMGLDAVEELDLEPPGSQMGFAGDVPELPDLAEPVGLPAPAKPGALGHRPASSSEADLDDLPSLGDELPIISAGLPDLDRGRHAGLPAALGGNLPSLGNAKGGALESAPPSMNLPSLFADVPGQAELAGLEGAVVTGAARSVAHSGAGAVGPSVGDDVFGEGPMERIAAAVSGGGSPSAFGEVNLGGSEDDAEFDAFPTEVSEKPKQVAGTPAIGYGEVALDGGSGGISLGEEVEREPLPPGPAADRGDPGASSAAASAQVIRPGGPDAPQIPIPRSRGSKKTKIAAGVLLLAAVGGGALSASPTIGPYGIHAISDFAQRDAHARLLQDDFEKVQKRAAADTVSDLESAFRQVETGRAGAPRYVPRAALLAYVGFLRQIRFGADSEVVASAKVLLDGLAETEDTSKFLVLSRLARSVAQGKYKEVHSQGASLMRQGPEFAALLGEAALALEDYPLAKQAFQTILSKKSEARAHYGLARVLRQERDLPALRAALESALKENPKHTGALLLKVDLSIMERSADDETLKLLAPLTEKSRSVSTTERVLALSLLGELHLSRSRIKQAEAVFAQALALESGNARAQRGLGRTLFESGRFGEALIRFESALKAAPSDLECALGVVETKLRLEAFEDAGKLLDELSVRYPKSTSVSFWAGRAKEAIGEKEAAEKAYENAVQVGENRPELLSAYVALTRLLGQGGKVDAAQETIAQAERRFPNNPEIYRALGELASNRGNYEEAIVNYDRAISLDANNIGFRFSRGIALRQARRFEEARAEFDAVEKVEKDFPGLALERGNLFEASGQSEEALKSYEAALAQAPKDPDLMLRVACGKANAGSTKDAMSLLKVVLEARPNSAEASFCQGLALLKEGVNLPDAKRYLERAVGYDPSRAVYHLYVGWLAIEMHDYALAESSLNQAISLDRTLGDAYWQRGMLRVRQGAVKDAEIDLRRALELNPTRYEAHGALADAYMQSGKEQDALVEWKSAVAADGAEGIWHYRYGRLLWENRRPLEAQPELSKAIEKESKRSIPAPWLWEAHRILAICLGPQKEAIPHFQAFLEKGDQNSPYRVEALREVKKLVAKMGGQ